MSRTHVEHDSLLIADEEMNPHSGRADRPAQWKSEKELLDPVEVRGHPL